MMWYNGSNYSDRGREISTLQIPLRGVKAFWTEPADSFRCRKFLSAERLFWQKEHFGRKNISAGRYLRRRQEVFGFASETPLWINKRIKNKRIKNKRINKNLTEKENRTEINIASSQIIGKAINFNFRDAIFFNHIFTEAL